MRADGVCGYRFAGGWRDAELGKQSHVNREYDPPTGRFLNHDPLAEAGGVNLYAYAGNDPVNAADPSGLAGEPVVQRIAGAVVDATTPIGLLRLSLGTPEQVRASATPIGDARLVAVGVTEGVRGLGVGVLSMAMDMGGTTVGMVTDWRADYAGLTDHKNGPGFDRGVAATMATLRKLPVTGSAIQIEEMRAGRSSHGLDYGRRLDLIDQAAKGTVVTVDLRTSALGGAEALHWTGNRFVVLTARRAGRASEAVVVRGSHAATGAAGSETVAGSRSVPATAEDYLNPSPNTVYESNGYFYRTNAEGKLVRTSGELRLEPAPRNLYRQAQVGRSSGVPGDEGGHMIGAQFGGLGEGPLHLVPQARTLNRGAGSLWSTMERTWAETLTNGDKIMLDSEINWPAGAQRPDGFLVHYEIIDPQTGVRTPVDLYFENQ